MQRLTDTWVSVSQNIIDEVVDQWRKRRRDKEVNMHARKQKDSTLNVC